MKMKLSLHSRGLLSSGLEGAGLPEAFDVVRQDPELMKIAKTPSRSEFHFGDASLEKILYATRRSAGWEIEVFPELDRQEGSRVTHFELFARKFIDLSFEAKQKNYGHLRALLESVPVGANYTTKPHHYFVDMSTKIPRNYLVRDDCDGEVYLCGESTIRALEDFPIRGVSAQQVSRLDGALVEDIFALDIETILPPAVFDSTRKKETRYSDSDGRNVYWSLVGGCIAYTESDIAMNADIAYTAEGYLTGSVIVSKKFRELIRKSKIKGVAFRPVLKVESTLYKEYIDLWSRVKEFVESVSRYNEIVFRT